MALHLAIIWVVPIGVSITISGDLYVPEEDPALDEYKGPERAVVQLSDTATYPEAVMVKFSDAPVAISTMFGPKRQHFDTANITTPISRNNKLRNTLNTWLGRNLFVDVIVLISRVLR